MSTIASVGSTDDFINNLDKQIIKLWNDTDMYKKKIDSSKDLPLFNFIDGPPFVSSENLHYGHILIGMIKSSVLFYQMMSGKRVTNTLGFDCHGLPTEMAMNKILNLKNNHQVVEYGVPKYIDDCKKMIFSYSGAWNKIYHRMGRVFDETDTYRTLDLKFMESVWNVWKRLTDKNLTYRGVRVMAYSTACNTCLSNFEAKQDYRERDDMSIFVKFRVPSRENTYILVWTTTPWTLPSNQALCVHPDREYVTIIDKKTMCNYICAKDGLVNIYPEIKKKLPEEILDEFYEITSSCLGSELKNMVYEPVFNYFYTELKVLTDNFVVVGEDMTVGTGVVHLSPAFGEDDFWVCIKNNLILPTGENIVCPINENGEFNDSVNDYKNMYWEQANLKIIEDLGKKKLLMRKQLYKHSYPYCERSGTPLIYMIVPSFFVAVTKIKHEIIENNKKVHWTPSHIGERRFHEWLTEARDWGVSRSRFFGTPIPVWISEDGSESYCFGSVKELCDFTGVDPLSMTDLHIDVVDKLVFTRNGKLFKRVPDVFDCWFESGSVPYGQYHYPFESPDRFDKSEFMCDFIAEGIDQTRGWFYTLSVLSTALFNKPAFKNVICTGLVLAEDGKKMSKRLNNFPNPITVMETYGADALRLYLLNSPLVRGESLCFSEKGVRTVLTHLIPWYESCRFFLGNYEVFKSAGFNLDGNVSPHIFDRWIVSKIGTLVGEINLHMGSFKLGGILGQLMDFIESLTNVYIQFNNNRLRNRKNDIKDWKNSLETLLYVSIEFAKIMSPFAPFLSEFIYQQLKHISPKEKELNHVSVIHCDYPHTQETDIVVERKMNHLLRLFDITRLLRYKNPSHSSVKMPFRKTTIYTDNQVIIDDLRELSEYMTSGINTMCVEYLPMKDKIIKNVTFNKKTMGQDFKKLSNVIQQHVEKLPRDRFDDYFNGRIGHFEVFVGDQLYIIDDKYVNVNIQTVFDPSDTTWVLDKSDMLVVIDPVIDDEIRYKFTFKVLMREVQQLRKDLKLIITDNLMVKIESESKMINEIIGSKIFTEKFTSTMFTRDDGYGEWSKPKDYNTDMIKFVIRGCKV